MPDYETGEPVIPDPSSVDPGDFAQAVFEWNQWLSANALNLPNVGTFDPNAGVPHFIRDGFRNWVNINIAALKVYEHFQTAIDSFLSPNAVAAMHVLLALLGEFETLNQAGPN